MLGRKTILILGGTGEARAIASALVARGHDVTSSLAGRTNSPLLPEGEVRIGGFGGVEGLAAYLQHHAVSLLIDATHPFAAQMSANAVAASARANVPLIRFERAGWERPDGASWVEVDNMEEAASALPSGAKVLLTIGRQEVGAFYGRQDCQFVARVIEEPEGLPSGWTLIKERGPFSVEAEKALLAAHSITHLVSKNSGGDLAAGKLMAAAQLNVPVVMVRRPALPDAISADTVDALLAKVDEL